MVWLQGHVRDWNQGRCCSTRFLNFSAATLITESLQGWVLERGFRRSAMGLQTRHPRPLQHPLDRPDWGRFWIALGWLDIGFLAVDVGISCALPAWFGDRIRWWSFFGAIGCLLLQDVNWKLWLDHPSMFGDRIKGLISRAVYELTLLLFNFNFSWHLPELGQDALSHWWGFANYHPWRSHCPCRSCPMSHSSWKTAVALLASSSNGDTRRCIGRWPGVHGRQHDASTDSWSCHALRSFFGWLA